MGGFDGSAVYDVELVSLDPILSPVPDCLTQLNPFPMTSYSAAGALDYSGTSSIFSRTVLETHRIGHFAGGGIPYVCGGGPSYYSDLCHKYVATSDEWVISGTMTESRGFCGYDSSESWGLVMAGGYDGYLLNYLSSVESTSNGETFGNLPDLEKENQQNCLVVVDDERIFTCGGDQGSGTDTFLFSNTTKLWSRYIGLLRTYFQ